MPRSRSAGWFVSAGIAMLVVGVTVLAVLALQRAAPETARQAPEPVPTFTLGAQVPTPTPTPTASAPTVRPEDVRMLSIGSEIWWRATAGDCDGIAPSVERSNDRGASWTDVTPTYLGLAQVQTLEAFSRSDAEIVATLVDCEPQALRTYTYGRFWEAYPDVLARARFIDPADPSSVRFPSGPVPAPCPVATGLHAFGDIVTLVCDRRAWSWSADQWVDLGVTDALAVDIDRSDILVAHASPDCAGVAFTRVPAADPAAATPAGCAADADTSGPVAIDGAGDTIVIWAGDAIISAS